jgi:thermolabile hemolysin
MTNKTLSSSFRARFGLLLAALMLATAGAFQAAQAQFKDFIIFGDSLSDVGNIASRSDDQLGISYPSPDFGYTDGRFTDGKDTDPAARTRTGVWHEQLAKKFLRIPRAKASLDGDTNSDYAFGGAKTIGGDTKRPVVEDPFFGNEIDLAIDNMGKQVDDYLAKHNPDPNSLFILWGGSNDLLDNPDSQTVSETANNVGKLITRLAQAGARTFLVPNVPPLNLTPSNAGTSKTNALAQASAEYHDVLAAKLDDVQNTLGVQGIQVKIYRLDVYNLFLRLVANPAAFGIANVTGNAQDNSDVNPDKYLFWDGLHPTTTGHYLLAAEAYTVLTGTPVVSINTLDSSVSETNGLGVYYLSRTGDDLSASLSVPYAVSGSATTGVDFKMFKGAKEIKPGRQFVQVKLKTLDDSVNEKKEDVTLTITQGSGFTLGLPTAATISIDDNDSVKN